MIKFHDTPKERTPFQAGQSDFLKCSGRPTEAMCPFTSGTWAAKEWVAGWQAERSDLQLAVAYSK